MGMQWLCIGVGGFAVPSSGIDPVRWGACRAAVGTTVRGVVRDSLHMCSVRKGFLSTTVVSRIPCCLSEVNGFLAQFNSMAINEKHFLTQCALIALLPITRYFPFTVMHSSTTRAIATSMCFSHVTDIYC